MMTLPPRLSAAGENQNSEPAEHHYPHGGFGRRDSVIQSGQFVAIVAVGGDRVIKTRVKAGHIDVAEHVVAGGRGTGVDEVEHISFLWREALDEVELQSDAGIDFKGPRDIKMVIIGAARSSQLELQGAAREQRHVPIDRQEFADRPARSCRRWRRRFL